MLNLRVDEDEDIQEEELELYSWFGDDEYRSAGADDTHSLEEEEEEDEEDADGNYTSNS